MAKAPLNTEQSTKKPAPKYQVRAVYGVMVHPFMPLTVQQETIAEVDEIDSWLQSQIDAGKISLV